MLWNRLNCHSLPTAPSAAITTSVDNSQARWNALFERLSLINGLPGGQLIIHDFGATPGVARIRIEQVFEEVAHA